MTISAKIIADSVSPQGIRLTTLQLRYQKFIHGEFMTHRVFSRNASSSRAIPVERLIQDVLDDPAMPVFWGKNRSGMQAVEEMTNSEKDLAILRWLEARNAAVLNARDMLRLGVHKQIVNRIIEPWCHINVVVTSTEWANFFALRRHKDAQPEMKALADAIWEAREASTPRLLLPGAWHLPYVSHDDEQQAYWETRHLGRDNSEEFDEQEALRTCIQMSVARCARVSYLTHEGKPPNVEDDLKLYDRLIGSVPLHASPAEHQATPDEPETYTVTMTEPTEQQKRDRTMSVDIALTFKHGREHGNFVGWRQFRKMLPNESVRDR